MKAVVQNKLLMGWLRVSQNNKVKFLKYLDVEEEPKLMENILLFIFKLSQSDEEIEELIQVRKAVFEGDVENIVVGEMIGLCVVWRRHEEWCYLLILIGADLFLGIISGEE